MCNCSVNVINVINVPTKTFLPKQKQTETKQNKKNKQNRNENKQTNKLHIVKKKGRQFKTLASSKQSKAKSKILHLPAAYVTLIITHLRHDILTLQIIKKKTKKKTTQPH